MRNNVAMKLMKLFAFCPLAFALAAAEVPPQAQAPTATAPSSRTEAILPGVNQNLTLLDRERGTNRVILVPGQDDWKIARLVAGILRQSHYSRKPLDDTMSSKFLDRYLDALDPAHLLFTQGDEEEFNRWRNTLDDLTLRLGDTSPAYYIFNRFLDRYEEQFSYITNHVAADHFDFTGDGRYVVNRRGEPRPKDLAEAHHLWRGRLRYEFLLETLNLAQPEEIGGILLKTLKAHTPQEIRDSVQASQKKNAALKKQEAAASAESTNATAHVETRAWNLITKPLKGKLGDEKVDEIADLVVKKLGQEKPEQIAQAIESKLENENHTEIVKIITRRYNRQWRMLKEFDNDDVLQLYLTALAHAYDPHSDYMSRSTLENFNISMKLSLFGIGALLRSEDGYVKIQELMPGPAMRSKKIKPNDRIVAVAQGTNEPVDVVDMKLSKVVDLIRGPQDTEVRLTIIPADAPDPSLRKVVALVRDKIKLEDQEAKAKIIELPQDDGKSLRLGIIDLPSFYADMDSHKPGRKSTTTDVGRLLTKLKAENVQGVVLDLRRNGGGSLEEAINLTGLFIKDGPVVQVRDPNGDITVDSDTDSDVLYSGPLIVLTSRFSASASEILAGAMQDYGRAVIVGDISTHGKGTVQSLLQLSPLVRPMPEHSLGALKYTIRKFYRVSGSSTQLKGVIPDVILPSVNNYADVGEVSLTNALPWDTISPADFQPVNSVTPYLDELRRRSALRVETNVDFAYIKGEIKRYRASKEEKGVSMNEAERIKQKDEDAARVEARKKELRARPESDAKTYDITLKNVDEPGLPPPTVKTNSVAQTTAATVEDHELQELKGDDDSDTAPSLDVTMEETKHILEDLISLETKGKRLAESH